MSEIKEKSAPEVAASGAENKRFAKNSISILEQAKQKIKSFEAKNLAKRLKLLQNLLQMHSLHFVNNQKNLQELLLMVMILLIVLSRFPKILAMPFQILKFIARLFSFIFQEQLLSLK